MHCVYFNTRDLMTKYKNSIEEIIKSEPWLSAFIQLCLRRFPQSNFIFVFPVLFFSFSFTLLLLGGGGWKKWGLWFMNYYVGIFGFSFLSVTPWRFWNTLDVCRKVLSIVMSLRSLSNLKQHLIIIVGVLISGFCSLGLNLILPTCRGHSLCQYSY